MWFYPVPTVGWQDGLIYGAMVLLGAAIPTLLVTALSMVADVIGSTVV